KAAADDVTVTEQAHAIIVPSYATWFDYNSIHALERRSLPELNPQEYLTFTACRRNLHGDVCGILRVHAFLEQWGASSTTRWTRSPSSPLLARHLRRISARLSDSPACLAPLKPAPPSGASEKVNGAAHPSDKDSSKDAASDIQKSEASSKQPDKPPASRKSDWNGPGDAEPAGGASSYSKTTGTEWPSTKAGNPIMCTVAFLAATVDPRIASAATKAALDEYAKMRDEIPNCVLKSHQQSVGDKEAADPARVPKRQRIPPRVPRIQRIPQQESKEAADPAKKSQRGSGSPPKSPKGKPKDPPRVPKRQRIPPRVQGFSGSHARVPKGRRIPPRISRRQQIPPRVQGGSRSAKSPREAADEEAKKAEPASALAAAAASAKQLAHG
uniref:SWIRM domain-containing protein n=1 Tax=Macrostomum lignano TaxID=282301 RepID=A0A1I8FSZ8_9PLAT